MKEIEKKAKADVDEAVEIAKNAPYPEISDLYKDVYTNNSKPYWIRAVEGPNSVVVN